MEKAKSPLEGFWERPLRDLLQQLQATPTGLTTDEAKRRLRRYGPNSLEQESRFATLFSIFRLFANPLVIILLVASGISLGLGDPVGGSIIIAIVLLSVLLNFLWNSRLDMRWRRFRSKLPLRLLFCVTDENRNCR